MTGQVVVVRHGETDWTITGQHTSRTDIALTEQGRSQAAQLRQPLSAYSFALVLTSPMRRAADTAELAGFAETEPCDDLKEWDYGAFEARTTAEIRETSPGWSLWRDGVPDGETGADVAARADRVIARVRAVTGASLLFSHGHFLRVLAARWIGLDAGHGALFALSPASVGVLGWEREQPVIVGWNDTTPEVCRTTKE